MVISKMYSENHVLNNDRNIFLLSSDFLDVFYAFKIFGYISFPIEQIVQIPY